MPPNYVCVPQEVPSLPTEAQVNTLERNPNNPHNSDIVSHRDCESFSRVRFEITKKNNLVLYEEHLKEKKKE